MPFKSALDQLAALRNKDLTAVELVEAAIAHSASSIRTSTPSSSRISTGRGKAAVAADRAGSQAATVRWLGLPITVKEAFDVAGLPTSWGIPGNHKPASDDAVLVERLRSAGAVILGKTNIPTMLSDWQTANPVFGVTNNPWDQQDSGGSSGGAAAAIAAGMSSLEFGSDLAGSLRIPAGFCGVLLTAPAMISCRCAASRLQWRRV